MVVNIDEMTIDQLRELVSLVATRINELEALEVSNKQNARQAVVDARVSLENLLGPEGAVPDLSSIRGVLAFGDETISQNSAQAVPLIIHGMEILTKTMVDITRIIKTD